MPRLPTRLNSFPYTGEFGKADTVCFNNNLVCSKQILL